MGDDERARRREFARRHHPDHGGDPAVFIAGWHSFGLEPGERPRVVVVPRRIWPARLWLALRAFHGDRHRTTRVH
jgi:hypothetical protein